MTLTLCAALLAAYDRLAVAYLTRAAIDGFGGFQHLVWGWAGKNGAWAGGIQHTQSYKTTVHRFMTAASTREKAYFSLHGSIRTHDVSRVINNSDQVGMSQFNAFQLFLYNVLR